MSHEPQFTRRTILVACDLIANHPAVPTHAAFGDFILELGLEDVVPTGRSQGYLGDKWHSLKKYLVANRSARTPDDEFIWDAVVRKAANLPYSFSHEELVRALERDAFTINEKGELRRMLPNLTDIPAANDEVHALLDELDLAVTTEHLDNAIDLHARGKWEPANGELRKVFESIFDEAAVKLEPNRANSTNTGQPRRQMLANLDQPFLIEDLGEWSSDGKNMVNGIFKRLNSGAHPGLSEDEDCTFRLHLVLISGRLFLRRLKARLLSSE